MAVHKPFSFTSARYHMLVNNMKALPKKRKHPTAQNLLVSLSKTSILKRQALWYSSFVAAYIWFMYWIAYDFFVWQKPIAEINPVNYAGAIATIAFIWAGTKLLKSNQTRTANTQHTLLPPPTQQPFLLAQKPAPPSSPSSKPQPKPQHQPRKTVAAPPISGCAHHMGYLNQREKSREIPAECLTCAHVIQCMSAPN